MKHSSIFAIALGALAISCSNQSESGKYTLTATATPDDAGKMAYIMNFDTGDKVDSIVVNGDSIVMSGTVATAIPARLIVGNRPVVTFILESGDINIDSLGTASGTPLNKEFEEFMAASDSLASAFQKADTDSARQVIYDAYNELLQTEMTTQAGNPVGFFAFSSLAHGFSPEQLDSVLTEHPEYLAYSRIQKLQTINNNLKATAPGAKFKDFTIEGDSAVSFSQYVGNGKFTIVDFWASWCGPCRQEMPVIKDLYDTYHAKGLDVLGVAVWDKPEDSKEAIEQLGLPWQQILNAQNVPTDLYGISGIPHIMLIGPDGTILARNLRGDSLRNIVKRAMERPESFNTAQATSAPDSRTEAQQ